MSTEPSIVKQVSGSNVVGKVSHGKGGDARASFQQKSRVSPVESRVFGYSETLRALGARLAEGCFLLGRPELSVKARAWSGFQLPLRLHPPTELVESAAALAGRVLIDPLDPSAPHSGSRTLLAAVMNASSSLQKEPTHRFPPPVGVA